MSIPPSKTNWLETLQHHSPLLIAGPCSAETEEQVLAVAHQLKNTDTAIMRAGLWKPRTRPGNFEGVGSVGLQWLVRAREETGLLLATEVANKTHVELALEADIDVLWIGARSTVSPFIVQEIADALQGTDKIVLVKNPVNPDLALWMGALERLHHAGIARLGAVHRGFSTYEKTKYRNNPEWQLAIDFQSRMPQIPLLLDPSHIAGRRDAIFELCQTAMDLNYAGLMVETHTNPDAAWSDAAQQITPGRLHEILTDIQVKRPSAENPEFIRQIETLRTQIDLMDAEIMKTLGKRMQVAEQIGTLKAENNVAILQAKRWQAVLDRLKKMGLEQQLSEAFITDFYKAMHQESIEHQQFPLKNKTR